MHQHIDSIHSLLSLFLLAVSLSVCPLSNQLQTENLLFERKLMNVCIMKNLIINETETLPASQALFSIQPSKWTFLKYERFLKSLDKRGRHGKKNKKKEKRRYEKRIIQETQSHKETAGGVRQKRQTMVSSNDFHVDLSCRLISTIFKINKIIIIQLKNFFIIFSR